MYISGPGLKKYQNSPLIVYLYNDRNQSSYQRKAQRHFHRSRLLLKLQLRLLTYDLAYSAAQCVFMLTHRNLNINSQRGERRQLGL